MPEERRFAGFAVGALREAPARCVYPTSANEPKRNHSSIGKANQTQGRIYATPTPSHPSSQIAEQGFFNNPASVGFDTRSLVGRIPPSSVGIHSSGLSHAYMRPMVGRRKTQGRIYATPTPSHPSSQIAEQGFFNNPALAAIGTPSPLGKSQAKNARAFARIWRHGGSPGARQDVRAIP